jgi:uncharacterized RDD family membrane protein YckC
MAIPVVDARFDTVGARFAAGLMDGLVFMPLGIVHALVISQEVMWLTIVWIAVSNPAGWLYSVICHALYGKTVGKHVMKVMVVDNKTESRVSWKQAILRDIFLIFVNTGFTVLDIYIVANGITEFSFAMELLYSLLFYGALIWFVLEIVTALTNDRRRAFHDIIAGTVVVKQ